MAMGQKWKGNTSLERKIAKFSHKLHDDEEAKAPRALSLFSFSAVSELVFARIMTYKTCKEG